MGACASAQLGNSKELDDPEKDKDSEPDVDSDVLREDPTAKRARQAANRFLQFTETLPSMAGKVVVVTGATGGPLLVAATLAERGAYVIIITAAPLRPEVKQMIESTMAEAVATFEQADDIPEEVEGDFSRLIPEEGSSMSYSREASTSVGRRRAGNNGETADVSGSGSGAHQRDSRIGNSNKGGMPLGESDMNAPGGGRGMRMGESADLSAPTVPRAMRMARTTRAAQAAHRASSMAQQSAPQGGARERLSPATKRGYLLVGCDYQDLPSVCDSAYTVLRILEKELKFGLDVIINMAEDRPRNEGSKRYSKDGFDCQIQGNLLSHYLLTQLLMPALTAGSETSGTGRIVNCTSGGLKMLRADINRELFEQMVVQDGDKRPYSLHDLRLKQSKKAAIVLTLGLRDVMKYANVNILPVTAHHGLHECIFSTRSPSEQSVEVSGSLLKARLTRSSTMDTWLPVLACVCSTEIQPGEFMIAGPDGDDVEAEGKDEQPQEDVGGGVGDPETLDLETLPGVEISDKTVQMVWEQCHQAVANYMPQTQ